MTLIFAGFVWLREFTAEDYDAVCKRCWPAGTEPMGPLRATERDVEEPDGDSGQDSSFESYSEEGGA